MANYIICKFCANLKPRTNNGICEHCMNDYHEIRTFVESHQNSAVMNVATNTGISVRRIIEFAQCGYFILVEGTLKGK